VGQVGARPFLALSQLVCKEVIDLKNAIVGFNTAILVGVIGWSIGSGAMDAGALALAGVAWMTIVLACLED
jgi:hypothetical protein